MILNSCFGRRDGVAVGSGIWVWVWVEGGEMKSTHGKSSLFSCFGDSAVLIGFAGWMGFTFIDGRVVLPIYCKIGRLRSPTPGS